MAANQAKASRGQKFPVDSGRLRRYVNKLTLAAEEISVAADKWDTKAPGKEMMLLEVVAGLAADGEAQKFAAKVTEYVENYEGEPVSAKPKSRRPNKMPR